MTTEMRDGFGFPAETRLDDLTLQVVEERLHVTKRRVATGTVRVSTVTEHVKEIAEVELEHRRVEVTRVPIGRVIEAPLLARAEGDTTINPIVEERFVW